MEVDTSLIETAIKNPESETTVKDHEEIKNDDETQVEKMPAEENIPPESVEKIEEKEDKQEKHDNNVPDDDVDEEPLKIVEETSEEEVDGEQNENESAPEHNDIMEKGNGKRSRTDADISSDEEEFAGFDESVTDAEGDSQNAFKKMKLSPSSSQVETKITLPILATLPPPPQPRVLAIPPATELLIPPPSMLAKKGGNRVLPITDPIYRKPFEYGWKRELVLRANPELSKEKGEVYYLTPTGKRLRTRNEIFQNLPPGNVLTMANFTFTKEAFGLGPEFETIRGAKVSQKARRSMAAELDVSSLTTGKRIPKPKAPKGASPPPPNRPLSFKPTGRTTLGAVGNSNMTPIKPGTNSVNKSNKRSEPCTIQCVLAMGIIPQLQCRKCLCLYHHACMGLDYNLTSETYVCQSCRPEDPTKLTPPIIPMDKLPGNVSLPPTWNQPVQSPSTPTGRPNTRRKSVEAPPQTIASINGRKFIVVPKAKIATTEHRKQSSGGSGSGGNDIHPSSQSSRADNSLISPPPLQTGDNQPMHNHLKNQRSKRSGLGSGGNSGNRTPKSASGTPNEVQSLSPTNIGGERLNNNNLSGFGGSGDYYEPVGFVQPYIPSPAASLSNYFANVSVGYDILLHTFQYLKVQELLRAGCVCRIWHEAAKHSSLWKTVRMKNSQINDWRGFATALTRNGTKNLDLRKMLLPKTVTDEFWENFSQIIGDVKQLESIDLCKCSNAVVEKLFETNVNLKIINAVTLTDDRLNLVNVMNLKGLLELRIKSTKGLLIDDVSPLQGLCNLKHLSLTSVRAQCLTDFQFLGDLINLESLELGECDNLSPLFVTGVLEKLNQLKRLRLEKGQESCATFDMLNGVSTMENLVQLELINFDIRAEFDQHIAKCTNIRKLLIIPTYVSQSSTTNQIILRGVMQLNQTLKNFTWAVTSELVRVTELYVNNCDSNKKNKKMLSDCVPVLKPVPGILESTQVLSNPESTDVPTVEILPLASVEKILSTAMPTTKVNMIIIGFHATWRQNLVEN